MLIIPLHRKPTLASWPWVTSLLIVLNVVIYLFGQSRDDRFEAQAQLHYFEQRLELVEEPLYLQYRESGAAAELPYDFDQLRLVLEGPMWRDLLFTTVNLDAGFRRALQQEPWAERRRELDADRRWERERPVVDALLERSLRWRYALRYDQPEPRRLLGSMFLHGSLGHLIGNMVFLALLGLLVEGALGGWLFAGLYVLAGVGGSLFSVLLRHDEVGFALGASGAIAGLMGAYCVLWGMRKVRFFYWFFVVFNYVRAPALLLLPMWLGWELWQLWRNGDAGIGFDAHAGGLLSGALLALLVRMSGLQRRSYLDATATPDDPVTPAAQQLRDALGSMDWFAARRAAERLQQLDPDSYASRLLIWHAWATASGAPPELHAAARAALTATPRRMEQLAERKRIWLDYLRASGNRPRLTREELVELGDWFARGGEVQLGLSLLRALRGHPPLAERVCQVLLRLALELRDTQPEAFGQVYALLQDGWPQSPQVLKLRQLLSLDP